MTASKTPKAAAKRQAAPVAKAAPDGPTDAPGATHQGDSTSTQLVNQQPPDRTIDSGRSG